MDLKKHLDPFIIDLKTLPQEGQSFTYDTNATETPPWKLRCTLQPLSNETFLFSGKLHAVIKAPCKYCQKQVSYEHNEQFKELLEVDLLKKDFSKIKNDKQGSKSNRKDSTEIKFNPNDECFVQYLPDYQLDLSRWMHEILTLAYPQSIQCDSPDCFKNLTQLLRKKNILVENPLNNRKKTLSSKGEKSSYKPFKNLFNL